MRVFDTIRRKAPTNPKRILLGRGDDSSLSELGSRGERLIGLLIVFCGISWGLGVYLPLMTVTKMIIFPDTYSILGFVQTLFEEGEWLLFLLVLLFGIVIPYLKLDLMYRIWRRYDASSDKAAKTLKYVEAI